MSSSIMRNWSGLEMVFSVSNCLSQMEIVADEIEMTCTTLLHKIWPNMREGPTTVIYSCLAVLLKLT
jgi:hypothetical protein